MIQSTVIRASVGLLSVALLMGGCAEDQLTSPDVDSPNFGRRGNRDREHHHVIALKEERAPSPGLLAAVRRAGGSVAHRHDEIGIFTVNGLSDAGMAALAREGEIEGIERDVTIQWIPRLEDLKVETYHRSRPVNGNDPRDAFFYDQFQWNMRRINAEKGWDMRRKGRGAWVCLVDTGVDTWHIDLAGRVDLRRSRSFVPGESIDDYNFHGSHVAGIITSNGIGVAGVDPNAWLIASKAFNFLGEATFDQIIDAVMHCAYNRADVINMSFGSYVPTNRLGQPTIRALQRAIDWAVAKGALPVAAAGNDNLDLDNIGNKIHMPSMLRNVTAATATGPKNQRRFDRLASYSNFGISGVDVAAPGGDVVGRIEDLVLSVCSTHSVFLPCGDGQTYLFLAGTSMATAHTSGAAALVESITRRNRRGEQLQSCIHGSANRITDGMRHHPKFGRGLIDVETVVERRLCRD